MQKILIVSSLLFSSVLADTSLGQKISVSPAQEQIVQTPSRTQTRTQVAPTRQYVNPQTRTSQPAYSNNQNTQLRTRLSPNSVKRSFKKDHHRYDKRYSNFDYDSHSYYNDNGYYYGYYDTTGYFYNNIFFAYDNAYSYRDRYHRRGHFGHGYHHRRHYIHHGFNNWNRIHAYRSPNIIVSGHYYDRSYYPRRHYNNYRSSYYGSHYNGNRHYNNRYNNHNNYRSPTRMNVTRMNGHNTRNNNTRSNNTHRSYSNNNNRNSRSNSTRRSQTRMTTRNSSSGHKSSRHMGMSR